MLAKFEICLPELNYWYFDFEKTCLSNHRMSNSEFSEELLPLEVEVQAALHVYIGNQDHLDKILIYTCHYRNYIKKQVIMCYKKKKKNIYGHFSLFSITFL